MERTDIQNRVQEIKDIAKNARSKTESVLVDLRKIQPSKLTPKQINDAKIKQQFGIDVSKPNKNVVKNPIKGSILDLTDKRGSIKLPGKKDPLIEEAKKYGSAEEFVKSK